MASPGPDTSRYGGNTSCVEVRGGDGTVLVLDAGSGIRRLGPGLPPDLARIDLLLTHLHMDHIQGLGFFSPLFHPGMEVHVWGPASTTQGLRARLARYLSPPLFPVHLRELACRLTLHEVPQGDFEVGELRISCALLCHPGPTVGYRISEQGHALAYLPDHEPALGTGCCAGPPEWTSGYDLAHHADLLIHDMQYTAAEYQHRVGWGHSSVEHAIQFARLAEVRRFLAFHHDPSHTDAELDRLLKQATKEAGGDFEVMGARENSTLEV